MQPEVPKVPPVLKETEVAPLGRLILGVLFVEKSQDIITCPHTLPLIMEDSANKHIVENTFKVFIIVVLEQRSFSKCTLKLLDC